MRIYTIEELAQSLGISASTIRAWENRYNLVSAARTQGGHRVYDRNDLRFYAFICHLKNKGNKLAAIAEKPLLKLKEEAAAFFASSAAPDKLSPFNLFTIEETMQALVENRIDDCLDAIDRATSLHQDAIEFSFFALGLLHEVGEAWARNRISVASEHLITARIRSALSNSLFDMRKLHPSVLRRTKEKQSVVADDSETKQPIAVLVAGLPGDLHEMGLLLVAIRLQSWGFRVCYLGPNLPTVEVQLFADKLFTGSFGIVCLGASAALDKHSATQSVSFANRFIGTRHVTFIGGGCTRHFDTRANLFQNLIFSSDLNALQTTLLELQKKQLTQSAFSAKLVEEIKLQLQEKPK